MNAPSVDIVDMLEADSALGLVFATNLFIGKEPIEPDDCVTVYDTAGFAPQITFDSALYSYPSVMIRVRAKHYTDAWDMINEIKVLLHGRAQETWNGTLYSVIEVVSDPGLIDYDENNRPRFMMNLNLQRR
jgi:hypothetical protein